MDDPRLFPSPKNRLPGVVPCDVVRRQQLVVTHVIPLDPHERRGMIGLGITAALIPADHYLLRITLQPVAVTLKLLILAMLKNTPNPKHR